MACWLGALISAFIQTSNSVIQTNWNSSGNELKLVFILNLVWWIAEIKPASPNETNSGSIKIESLLLISDFGFSRQNGNQIQEIQTFNLMAGIVSVTETGQSIH